jgi:hypothetical protein
MQSCIQYWVLAGLADLRRSKLRLLLGIMHKEWIRSDAKRNLGLYEDIYLMSSSS